MLAQGHRQNRLSLFRHKDWCFALSSFLIILIWLVLFDQRAFSQAIYISPACEPVVQSAQSTAAYYQRGQLVKAESQHKITLSLLRQLKSLELIRCSFDAQSMFPLEGKKYPAYITEYSSLAFDEAIRTKNFETAAQLLAQKAGISFSKTVSPETMQLFLDFGIFFDSFSAVNIYESEDEIVRKAQLFKDSSRRYARFMYRTNKVRPPLCKQNDCLHLGWDMQEKIKSRVLRAQILRGALLRLDNTKRDKVKDLLLKETDLRLQRNQSYFSSKTLSSATPYDVNLREVEGQIINLIPEYKELASKVPTPEEISQVLEPEETLLSFFFNDSDDKAIYVWKLERDSVPSIEELKITTEELYEKIRYLKNAIEKGSSYESIKMDLTVLHGLLIVPFHLRPNRRLIIATDQNLSSLPFDIMPWGTQGMMLDSFAISYVPSASVFYHLRNRANASRSTELPYKVEYAGFSCTNECELNYANSEISRAGIGFGASPPNIIQRDSLEADLYRNSAAINNARYLHLVTHSSPMEGISGGFYLPFGKGDGEDGKLTSYEIVARLKNHSELVVLSACQTATSKENIPPSAIVAADPSINGDDAVRLINGCICNYGESFSNLSGSFFAAGSKKLLLTQWLIRDDEKTAEFVKRVFDMLRDGKEPSEAVRLAKQQMRNDKKENVPLVNWAGFILAGG